MTANALRQAIDALAGSDADAGLRMVAFQAQLLNSDARALVQVAGGAVIDPPELGAIEARLALAAAAEGVAVEGNGAAALIDGDSTGARIVIHRLPQATPLAQALARERLELAAAVGRAHAGADDPAFAATLAGFAAASWTAPALHGLVAAMASQTGAPRLALALLRRRRVVQVADSGAASLADEARRRLELAGGEVADSGTLIVDAGGDGFTGLDRLADGAALRGIAALSASGDGVVVLLWGPNDGARAIRHAAALAPVVTARLQRPGFAERFDALVLRLPWPARVIEANRPRFARRLLAGLAGGIVLLPLPDGVSAPLTIEPLVRRAVTAPATARIEAVQIEPGDSVAAGQLLVRLDADAIASEREAAQSALQGAAGEAARARADGDVDAERIAQFRVAQLAAQVTLLDGRFAETEVLAPIAGIVGGEDLRRRIGAGVNRGELLFTIAAAKGNRADIRVADSEIDRVAIGQRVSMALAARPLARIGGRVTRIYPLAEVIDGRNVFRTVAAIDADDSAGLRPGMAGTASIRSGWAPLAWQVLRAPLRWVRLKLWV
jgi:hypothetical protein